MGAYYLHTPDARANFFFYIMTYYVMARALQLGGGGGAKRTGGGGTNGKNPKINIRNQKLKILIIEN